MVVNSPVLINYNRSFNFNHQLNLLCSLFYAATDLTHDPRKLNLNGTPSNLQLKPQAEYKSSPGYRNG